MSDEIMQLLRDWEVWEADMINDRECWPLWSPFPVMTTRIFAAYLKLTARRLALKQKIKNHIALKENWLD